VILDELRASCNAEQFWRQNRSLETQNGSYFHLLPTRIVFEIENLFSWIFNAISTEKRRLNSMPFLTSSTLHQDTRIFPACWILIGQFKFPALQPYARNIATQNCKYLSEHGLLISDRGGLVVSNSRNGFGLWSQIQSPKESLTQTIVLLVARNKSPCEVFCYYLNQKLPKAGSQWFLYSLHVFVYLPKDTSSCFWYFSATTYWSLFMIMKVSQRSSLEYQNAKKSLLMLVVAKLLGIALFGLAVCKSVFRLLNMPPLKTRLF